MVFYRKHPRLTAAALTTLTISSILYILTNSSMKYLAIPSLPGENLLQQILQPFTQHPVLALILLLVIVTGLFQFSGEGYTEIEI